MSVLDIIAWTVFYFVVGFMIVGATMLVVDTVIQWRREVKARKAWQKATF